MAVFFKKTLQHWEYCTGTVQFDAAQPVHIKTAQLLGKKKEVMHYVSCHKALRVRLIACMMTQ